MQGFSYDQLVQALQAWPQNTNDDEDAGYVDNIQRLIGLGELRLVKDLNLDIFDHTESLAVAAGDSTVEKPEDWIATRNVWRTLTAPGDGDSTARTPMHLRSLGWVRRYSSDPSNTETHGAPLYYAEASETELEFGPPADVGYDFEFHYVRRPPGLSADNQNTWLGDKVGDVLFAACLMEAEHFIKADDRYGDMKTKYYEELIPIARAELRRVVRMGDYTPVKPAARTVE